MKKRNAIHLLHYRAEKFDLQPTESMDGKVLFIFDHMDHNRLGISSGEGMAVFTIPELKSLYNELPTMINWLEANEC